MATGTGPGASARGLPARVRKVSSGRRTGGKAMRGRDEDSVDEQARDDRGPRWSRSLRRRRTTPQAGYQSGIRRGTPPWLCVHDDCSAFADLACQPVDHPLVVRQQGDAGIHRNGSGKKPVRVISLCDKQGESHVYLIGDGQDALALKVLEDQVKRGSLDREAAQVLAAGICFFGD